jgi:hypothetical protein
MKHTNLNAIRTNIIFSHMEGISIIKSKEN